MVFHFMFLAVRDALLAHAVWLLPIGLVLALVLIPGAPGALLGFVRTTVGRIVIACVLASVIGWEVRGYVDGVATLRRQAQAAAYEAAAQIKAAKAQAALSDARLAIVRRQAEVANRLQAEATDRAATNEAAILSYQKREADYEASLEQAAASGGDHPCVLGDADVRGLRHAASAYASDRTAAAGRPRKLR